MESSSTTIDNIPRRIDTVRSTHPERFVVRLLPLCAEESPLVHEIAGRLIARLEVVARTERPGRLDGEVEIGTADGPRRLALIPVVGEIVGLVETWPDVLVLPRRVGSEFLDSGEILLGNPDGKPIGVEVVSVTPGVSASIDPVADREDQRLLRVEGRAAESGKVRHASAEQITVRIRCGGEEATLEIPILLAGKPLWSRKSHWQARPSA